MMGLLLQLLLFALGLTIWSAEKAWLTFHEARQEHQRALVTS